MTEALLTSAPTEGWPETAGAAREALVLDAFRQGGGVPIEWVDVVSEADGHKATIKVASDALSLGSFEQPVRPAVTPRTAQALADLYGCVLPTSRVSDIAWRSATIRLAPHTQADTSKAMSNTSHFLAHNVQINVTRGLRHGLASTVGKDWILSRRLVHWPGWAVTYGWHMLNGAPIQARGPEFNCPAHNLDHVDYAQLAPRLVHRSVIVDGVEMDFGEVLAHPTLHVLVSDEGPIPFVRLPRT